MASRAMKRLLAISVAVGPLAFGVTAPAGAVDGSGVILNHSIGYLLAYKSFAAYTTGDKTECPHGLNEMGPREIFAAKFPDDGTPHKFVDTALAYESEVWFPDTKADPYPIPEVSSKIALGLNLDGKVGPNDFTSPDGEPGIDNQFYRATGCIKRYRNTSPRSEDHVGYNRFVIEITGIDNLENDDDVTVTTYKGVDPFFTDGSGNEILPRGTQHLDTRWGKEFTQHFHGKIRNGVLETDAADMSFPESTFWEGFTVQYFHNLRWRLKLTADSAEGLAGGYLDIKNFYRQLNETTSTHHQSYGQLSAPALYRAVRRYADAYPDPKTGENQAISAAFKVRFTQVFVQHPAEAVASTPPAPQDARPAVTGRTGQ